jgi:hypothetical protein
LEQAYESLNALIIFHVKSNTGGDLPPSVLNHVGKFMEYFSYTKPWDSTKHYHLEHFTGHILSLNPSKKEAESRKFSIKVR